MGIYVGVSLYPYSMTAYYAAIPRCKITKKSATKRLTVPAYLFISIDFGLVRALYMPDKPKPIYWNGWAKENCC